MLIQLNALNLQFYINFLLICFIYMSRALFQLQIDLEEEKRLIGYQKIEAIEAI